MKYQQLKTKRGIVIIRDAIGADLSRLIPIYTSSFRKHNIFQRTTTKILQYLKETHQKNALVGGGYLVAASGSRVVGGMLVRKEGEDLLGKHVVWKYNHLAVERPYAGLGIGTALLQSADKKVRTLITSGKIKTAKVELGVSINEKALLPFYKKCGFRVEGKLPSHYRYGELVYVLGKEIIK